MPRSLANTCGLPSCERRETVSPVRLCRLRGLPKSCRRGATKRVALSYFRAATSRSGLSGDRTGAKMAGTLMN